MRVMIINGYFEGKDVTKMKIENMTKVEKKFYEFYMNIKTVI